MPRQNRVTPFGDLIATPARGTFMGNRGILHDSDGNLTAKRWTHQHWVTCLLEVPGKLERKVFTPGNYTELFFRDEATALAAGHRPCAECRREDFKRFVAAWHKGNSDFGLPENAPIAEIDRILHRERVTRGREKVTFEANIDDLPDGVFVVSPEAPETACLKWGGFLHVWRPEVGGGDVPVPLFKGQKVTVLTPRSIVRAIAAGYMPQVVVG